MVLIAGLMFSAECKPEVGGDEFSLVGRQEKCLKFQKKQKRW